MKQNKISGVYKITNTITGDFYIGSSRNVKKRWTNHKAPSTWAIYLNLKLYQDMAQFGLNNFKFEILEETDNLREREQYWINILNPIYNNYRANGLDIERYRETNRKASKEWNKSHYDEYMTYQKEYKNRLCLYEGEILTLNALIIRFHKQGINHPTQEAKKYLLEE